MHLFRCIYWCLLLFNLEFYQTANTCAFFTLNGDPVVIKDSVATLSFKVNNTCTDGNTAIENVRITLQEDSPPHLVFCDIKFVNGVCSDPMGCKCNTETHEYTVSRQIDIGQLVTETWELSGKLQNGHQFRLVVQNITSFSSETIVTSPCVSLETTLSVGGSLIEDQSQDVILKMEQELTTTNTKQTIALDEIHDIRFFMLMGSIGFVVLLIVVLSVVFGAFLKKRVPPTGGRPFTLPPPVPHGLRPRLPEDIVPQDVLRTVRNSGSTESFLATEDNIYWEIDDSGHQATTQQNEFGLDNSYSSGSFAPNETLTTIAIASSDSNVSDGYLHPVSDSCEPEGNRPFAAPSVPGASGDTAASSSQSHFESDDYLHPVAFNPKTTTNLATTEGNWF